MMKTLAFAFAALLAAAQPGLAQQDMKGAADHPLISRAPGARIAGYHESGFQKFLIATGPIAENAELPPVERFEGEYTAITYVAEEPSLSALAIFRNYQKAFSDAGFEEIFSCESDAECGVKFVRQLYWYGDPQRQGQNPYLDAPNRHGDRHGYYYWSGKAKAESGSYILSLLVAQDAPMKFPAVTVLDIG
ncbi:MAG: hypothetical protein ACK5MQ_06605 [Pikeienuella sp.]